MEPTLRGLSGPAGPLGRGLKKSKTFSSVIKYRPIDGHIANPIPVLIFFWPWRTICTVLHIPEEISQSLLTYKNQGNWTKYMPLTLFSQLELALTARNTLLRLQSLEHLNHFKNGSVPYLGLELTIHIIKSQINLPRQSL